MMNIQFFNISIFQYFNISIFQYFNFSIFQYFNFSIFQFFSKETPTATVESDCRVPPRC